MRIAIVVQRYGLDVHGGAEAHARVWAERLAAHHHVEVLTTCARDYLTWADFYPAGRGMINGVQVQRFPVDTPRDIEAFNTFGHIVFGGPHTEEQELEWMRQQGPYSSQLYAAISAQADDFDLFIFMTYLYCTTFFGLPLVREKAVLVPTAHDEPPIYLRIFKQLFTAPRYIIYNTPSERRMLHRLFPIAHIPGREVGVGVDIIPRAQPNFEADPPTLLFIGRVHPSKGCDQLYEDFVRYRKATSGKHQPPLKLVFAGRADMTLPEHPDVEMLGFVSEEQKQELIERCTIFMLPSPFESLSIVSLEAWGTGKPTLVNGAAEVMRAQTLRSGGGLFYRGYDEFAGCLDVLLSDASLRAQLGRQGQRFVEHNYTWPVVEARLELALEQASNVVTNNTGVT